VFGVTVNGDLVSPKKDLVRLPEDDDALVLLTPYEDAP